MNLQDDATDPNQPPALTLERQLRPQWASSDPTTGDRWVAHATLAARIAASCARKAAAVRAWLSAAHRPQPHSKIATMRRRFEVPDDSGFIALVDPDVYQGFVDPNWTYESLFAHFRDAMMQQQSLLLWGTGREDLWTVEVVTDDEAERPAGHRRVTGPIRVTAGRLHLTSYESLTMAAQFPDVRLPEPHLQDLVVELPVGHYAAEIIQLLDPDEDATDAKPDFVIALTSGQATETWRNPPWHDA